MAYDPECFKAAQYMVEKHGAEAASRARHRATALRNSHDDGLAIIWDEIALAIVGIRGDAEHPARRSTSNELADIPAAAHTAAGPLISRDRPDSGA